MEHFDQVLHCVHCQATIPPHAAFCPVCGRSTADPDPANSEKAAYTHCSRCKNRLEPEARFCLHCGLAVDEMNPAETGHAEEKGIAEPGDDDEIGYPAARNSYPTLRLIGTLFWVIGAFVILGGVLGGIGWAILARLESWFVVFAVLGSTILAVLISLVYFAISESLRLIMDIEENQEIQVELLEELTEHLIKK